MLRRFYQCRMHINQLKCDNGQHIIIKQDRHNKMETKGIIQHMSK